MDQLPALRAQTGPAREALGRAGIIPPSVASIDDVILGLRELDGRWELIGWAPGTCELITDLAATTSEVAGGLFLRAPADERTAVELRRRIDWLRPRPVGPRASIGLGDRIGLATPGHIRALRGHPGLAPVLAQQSARELQRCGRRFADVLTAATFGVMAEGWREGFGADADHLKSTAEVDTALATGFTSITADPIDLMPGLPADAPASRIVEAFARIDWAALEDDETSFRHRYPDQLQAVDRVIPLTSDALTAAAARYAPALAYLVQAWRRVEAASTREAIEFEVAVDEIGHPTTAVDHVYLATELRRLGVRLTAFAPRFAGTFEKGVDYIGDPVALEADVALHASIAGCLGPYKLSVHSGSDKFSIYEAIRRSAGHMVHLKTSGTSYLEALRTIAGAEPALFRSAWRIAAESYSKGRSSYYVSARLEEVPEVASMADDALPGLLDMPSAREVLHVGFGAVLTQALAVTGPVAGHATAGVPVTLAAAVYAHREPYWTGLASHIGRHLASFSGT